VAPKKTFLEELEDARASIQIGGRCSFGEALRQMSADDRAVLENAIVTGKFPSTAIANALKKRGFEVKAQSVQRHRRSACSCRD
jgi:hypothetical protein